MKFRVRHVGSAERTSLPVRGAWVEIRKCGRARTLPRVSLPVRGAWVEIDSDNVEQ